MILSNKEIEELKQAAHTLITFLRRYHPHVSVIVNSETAELVEGIVQVKAM